MTARCFAFTVCISFHQAHAANTLGVRPQTSVIAHRSTRWPCQSRSDGDHLIVVVQIGFSLSWDARARLSSSTRCDRHVHLRLARPLRIPDAMTNGILWTESGSSIEFGVSQRMRMCQPLSVEQSGGDIFGISTLLSISAFYARVTHDCSQGFHHSHWNGETAE
jgi:hypothetical protein